jgi:hypothetical protein
MGSKFRLMLLFSCVLCFSGCQLHCQVGEITIGSVPSKPSVTSTPPRRKMTQTEVHQLLAKYRDKDYVQLAHTQHNWLSTSHEGCRYIEDSRLVSITNYPEAYRKVFALQKELGEGWVAFMGEKDVNLMYDKNFNSVTPEEEPSQIEVVVTPGYSQFDIVYAAQPSGLNYDLSMPDIVRKLQDYDKKYGIVIFGACHDTVSFHFKNIPADEAELRLLCNDLYTFCPDLVTQNHGTVEKLMKHVRRKGPVDFWWD